MQQEQEVVQLQAMDRLGGAARWNEPPRNNIRQQLHPKPLPNIARISQATECNATIAHCCQGNKRQCIVIAFQGEQWQHCLAPTLGQRKFYHCKSANPLQQSHIFGRIKKWSTQCDLILLSIFSLMLIYVKDLTISKLAYDPHAVASSTNEVHSK